MGQFPHRPTYPIDVVAPEGSGILITKRGATLEFAVDRSALPSGGNGAQVGRAGEVVSGQRVLRSLDAGLAHASNLDPTHFGRVVGVSINAAPLGSEVQFVTAGPIDDPTWAWSIGPVFLGEDGVLTQDFLDGAPAAFLQQIGLATSSTRLLVQIAVPIRLA